MTTNALKLPFVIELTNVDGDTQMARVPAASDAVTISSP
jgi:hypothetical protein